MKTRIITAIFASLFFFPFVIFGGYLFYGLMALIAAIALVELKNMRQAKMDNVPLALFILLLFSILLPDISAFSWVKVHLEQILIIITLLSLCYTVVVKNIYTFDDVAVMLLATVYIGYGFHYFIEVQRAGLNYIFFAIVIILATDTGAYFCGRKFGKHKLWPEISPNKTIEGAIGGIVLALGAGVLFHLFFPVHASLLTVSFVIVTASIVGQMGDLVESAFKRHYDVKDSGSILPGHGGILDRFDSWLLVFTYLYLIPFIG